MSKLYEDMIPYASMLMLFETKIDDLSTEQLLHIIHDWLGSQKGHAIFTPNPEFLLVARKNKPFRELLNQSDLSIADGIGLQFAAAALTGHRLEHRQTGIDTLFLLAQSCQQEQKRLLLFGGTENTAVDTATELQKKFHGLDVISYDPGYISGDAESINLQPMVIEDIQTLQPDVIAIALGQGKQERCCVEFLHQFPNVKIVIGVGGAFDTISGLLPRAPKWMRKHGLEWMWRLRIEPKRFPRIFRATFVFPYVVFWDTLKRRRFWKAFFAVMKEFTYLGKI